MRLTQNLAKDMEVSLGNYALATVLIVTLAIGILSLCLH